MLESLLFTIIPQPLLPVSSSDTYSLTSALLSRFVLDLQAAHRESTHASPSCNINSIVISRIIGSLNASIGPEQLIEHSHEQDNACNEEGYPNLLQDVAIREVSEEGETETVAC